MNDIFNSNMKILIETMSIGGKILNSKSELLPDYLIPDQVTP